MVEENGLRVKLKLILWSVSAGTIVAYFFATNFLAWATEFNPGGSVLFFSPLMCGLILGIITCEMEAINTVISSIIMTIWTTVAVIITLMAPLIFGIVLDPTGTLWMIHAPENMLITIILVLPISLLGAIVGRLFAENTILSSSMRRDRDMLKLETEEWYRMLEEKLEEKREALEKVRLEQESNILKEKSENLPEE
jgi:hypothetical protein